ncbi:MAG: hypothetical protein H6621_13040 [Halobacteriovoraceae bacterium]|nr:hypothetical protein [Halobacteriovoraceae bacterium]
MKTILFLILSFSLFNCTKKNSAEIKSKSINEAYQEAEKNLKLQVEKMRMLMLQQGVEEANVKKTMTEYEKQISNASKEYFSSLDNVFTEETYVASQERYTKNPTLEKVNSIFQSFRPNEETEKLVSDEKKLYAGVEEKKKNLINEVLEVQLEPLKQATNSSQKLTNADGKEMDAKEAQNFFETMKKQYFHAFKSLSTEELSEYLSLISEKNYKHFVKLTTEYIKKTTEAGYMIMDAIKGHADMDMGAEEETE